MWIRTFCISGVVDLRLGISKDFAKKIIAKGCRIQGKVVECIPIDVDYCYSKSTLDCLLSKYYDGKSFVNFKPDI